MGTYRFLLLQINDALFPIGGYSHSYGLETYIQKDLVHDAATAYQYLADNLVYNFLHSELLTVKLAYEYALADDLDALLWLEKVVSASKASMEIRLASHKLGSRFIKTVLALPIESYKEIFERYAAARKDEAVNHAVAYGVFCAAIGCGYQTTAETFLYAQTSALVTNCVKLIPLSQTTGQELLYRCYSIFDQILKELEHCTKEQLFCSTPGFEVRAMQHEGLYSRLYMS